MRLKHAPEPDDQSPEEPAAAETAEAEAAEAVEAESRETAEPPAAETAEPEAPETVEAEAAETVEAEAPEAAEAEAAETAEAEAAETVEAEAPETAEPESAAETESPEAEAPMTAEAESSEETVEPEAPEKTAETESPARTAETESPEAPATTAVPATAAAPAAATAPVKKHRALRTAALEGVLALVSGVVSLALAVVALRITPTTLAERWTVGGADQVLHYAIFSSATDVFPFFPNDRLGFPESMNLFFAPLFDVWSAVFVWAITPWVSEGVLALNLYNLASFVATGVTAYFFFRALRTRRVTAVVFGVLFSVLPYHFVQMNFGHPFLANYWAVPLIGVLLLVVAGEATDPFGRWAAGSATRRGRVLRRLLPIAALALAIALTQSYYFVFAGIVLGCAWVVTVARTLVTRDSPRALLWPTVTLAALGGFIVLQLGVLSLDLGDRYERYFQGRSAAESELYGGKLMSLLLPSPTSGFPGLADLGRDYADTTKILLTSENPSTAVVVSVALILALAVLVIRLSAPGRGAALSSDLERKPSLLVHDPRVSALLVGTVLAFLFFITAGLGAFIAYFASPEIRAWSRMSIVLSLFALGILAVLLDAALRRIWLLLPALALVCAVAYVDQIAGVSQSSQLQLSPTEDAPLRDFVAEAEDALPQNCGVVQLPLKDFPETGDIGRMGDYDEALPYVYAQDDDLRWSYGAVRGTTSADDWDDATNVPLFAREVRESGACAVLVDTYAYSEDVDGWQPFVERVADLDDPLLTSTDSDERYLLFRIGGSSGSSTTR